MKDHYLFKSLKLNGNTVFVNLLVEQGLESDWSSGQAHL